MSEKSPLTIYPLGSTGWFPSNGMETACFAFRWEDELIIIDAGTGIRRILELKHSIFKPFWNEIKTVRILLTHYHLDHIMGLFWMRGLFGEKSLRIYGPGESVYGIPASDILSDIFKAPASPHPFFELHPDVDASDFPDDGFDIGDVEKLHVTMKVNHRHTHKSIAFRFGNYFAFVTDTPPEIETVDFIKGVDVLLHECWDASSCRLESRDDELEKHAIGPHTSTAAAGLIASRAGVKRLYMIHHNPERMLREIESDAENVGKMLKLECVAVSDLKEIRIR